MKRLIEKNIHIVTMMKRSAIAYELPKEQKSKRRGRPKKYGRKIKLFDLFKTDISFIKIPMPGNANLMIEYHKMELFWRPLGRIAQFVLTRHPIRGNTIVLSMDLLVLVFFM